MYGVRSSFGIQTLAQFALSASLFWSVLQFYTKTVLPYIERRRNTVQIYDPILVRMPCFDTTNAVNQIEHACMVVFIPAMLYTVLWVDPWHAPLVSLSWSMLFLLRSLTLYVCPFQIPEGHIHLQDPMQTHFIKREQCFDNDMFFSGHCSALFMMGLTSGFPCLQWFFIFSMLVTTVLMMISRIHYTVDLIVAPFMAFGCYHLARWVCLP